MSDEACCHDRLLRFSTSLRGRRRVCAGLQAAPNDHFHPGRRLNHFLVNTLSCGGVCCMLPLSCPPPPQPDDRLFDVSFVSRCLQKGALRRVQGAVIGGDRLIGVCHISSRELRALGSSTVPADLKLRDPR